MDDTKLRGSLTIQAFWLLIAKTFAFGFALALPVLLTRTLSQYEYGLFKQVFLIITTATALLPFGFGLSAYYYLPRETDAERRGQVVFNILLFNGVIGVVACLVFILWPGLIATIFRDPTLPAYSSAIGVVILLWLFSSFLETAAVANQELRLATIFIVGSQLTRTILLLAAAIVFDSVQALIYAAVIHGVVQSGILIAYVSSRFKGFWRAFDWSITCKQVAYALPFGFAGLLYTIQTDLHNYFVSNNFSAATFAVYSIGVAQLPLIGIIRDSVSSVILPRINYLQDQGEVREIVVLLVSAIRKLAVVFLPIYAFLMVTGREFLIVMFTSAYAESWPSFAMNLTLLPLSLLEVDALARAYEVHRFFLLKLQVALTLFMGLALWPMISHFGLVGAITVVVAINFLLRVLLAAKFSSVLELKLRDLVLLKDVGKLILASAIAAFFCVIVRSLVIGSGAGPLVIFSVCLTAFAAVYVPTMFLFGVPTSDERRKVRRGIERLLQFA